MKKLISILLAITFVVSAMAFTASAADEYYSFALDQGLISGSGLSGTGTSTLTATGEYRLTTNDTALYLRGWAVSATGVKDVQYSFNGADWASAALDDRTDLFENGSYKLDAHKTNCIVPAEAPKPQFVINVDIATLNLVLDSIYTFQVKIITNGTADVAGEEILIVDVTVPYTTYQVSTEPQTPNARGNCTVSLDNVSTRKEGATVRDYGNADPGDVTLGTIDAVNFWGWISVDQAADWATAFGYSVNDGEIVYGTDWSVAPEPAVIGQPYDYDYRFDIAADVSALELGTHNVKAYCKLNNGEQIILADVTLNLVDTRIEAIPAGLKTGISSFTANSLCTFEYPQYVAGSDLSQSSSTFEGGSPFRAEWSPRPIAAAGMQVNVESVTDETTGETTITNKYGSIWGFNTHYSDHDWEGAYTFTSKIKVPNSSALSRGMFVNFSGSEGLDGAGNPLIYEQWCVTPEGYVVAGASGINVLFPDVSTMIVAVPTFDDTVAEGDTSAQGAIYAIYSIPNAFATFATVEITDDNNGNVFVSVNGEVISKVTYADAGMFAHTYDQGYYKTAAIYDYKNGGVVATTDKAVIWKYKTVGFATRSNELHIDDFQIVEAKAVTEPATTVHTSLELKSNSLYTVDNTNGAVIIRASNMRGESQEVFNSNIRSNIAYYQVLDKTGTVVENKSKMYTGYKLQMLGLDGSIICEYDVVLLGDCDNNARFSSADVNGLRTILTNKPDKGTVEFLCANVDGNTRLSAQDTNKLRIVISSNVW